VRARAADTVLVGGGLAAQRCCETLRARGYDGPLTLLAEEPHAPYDRPPLSKALLAGAAEDPSLRPAGWHEAHGVELRLGTRAVALDTPVREVVLGGGARLRYERLLIATGARARRIPLLCRATGARRGVPATLRAGAHELRTLEDARALRAALAPGMRLAVVGAGLVGLEVAATARGLGAEVTVVEAAPLPLGGATASTASSSRSERR
jgi:3-phenylpropionate/trans-cinnamate dioxygenase ferredoxin reductase subunit